MTKTNPTSAPRILLLAGDVAGNRGDRAIRAALTGLVRRIWSDAQFLIISKQPDRDCREFGADVLGHNAASLVFRAAVARRCDFAIWGGGQLLQDDSSFVKNLYWFGVLFWTRRVLGVRIIGCGLGVGPLTTRAGRWLASLAMRQLDEFIGRDERSCDYVRELTHEKIPATVAPDIVWFLEPPSRETARAYLAKTEAVEFAPGEIVLGVALRRWFHLKKNVLPYSWSGGAKDGAGDERFERFLDNVAGALRSFCAGRKVRVLFFCMGEADWEGDASFARRVAAASGVTGHVLKLECDSQMIQGAAGCCNLFLSVRMHAALLALSMAVPSGAMYHVPKVLDLFASLGLGDCAMPIEAAAESDGAARIEKLLRHIESDRAALSAQLASRVADARQKETIYEQAIRRMMQHR